MNWMQIVLIGVCLWVVTITFLYLREYVRHRYLRSRLDELLVDMTASSKDPEVSPAGRTLSSHYAAVLEKVINE